MRPECLDVRHALESETVSSEEVRAHIDSCVSCQAHARVINVLMALAPGEANDATVNRVLKALPPATWQRRRVMAWLPLAAGLLLAVVGMVLVGSVPGGSATSLLPGAAGGFAGSLTAWLLDVLVALRSSASAVQVALAAGGMGLIATTMLTAVGGGWLVFAFVRRRRTGH